MNNTHPKNKSLPLLTLLALLVLAIFAGTTAQATGLRLLYANDNLGELDGCG